jgi:hypothetical protein
MTYAEMDENNDGRISLSELETAVNGSWIPFDRIVKWFMDLDVNNDTRLTRSEGMLLQKRLQMEVKRCIDEAVNEFEVSFTIFVYVRVVLQEKLC